MELNPAIWVKDGRQYLTEVRSEFRKITWPTQKEYVSGTIGVAVIVAFMTTILGVVDAILATVMEWMI